MPKKFVKSFPYFLLLCLIVFTSSCSPATTETVTVVETVIVEGTPQIVESVVEVTAEPAEAAEVDKNGGTFIWGVPEDFQGFNPILNDEYTELYVFGMVSEPLTWGGENYPTELNPILAESWEVSEDGLVWTINLRQGVTWQDGVEFTAEDVVFWAEAIQDEDTGPMAEWLRPRFSVNDVPYLFEAIDTYTVQITTAEPVAGLLNLICVPLIPKHYFVENGIANQDMENDISNTEGTLGTGAFTMTEHLRGEAAIMEANPNYWRGAPYLDKIVMQVVPDDTAMIAALQAGEIDWAYIAPQNVSQLIDNDNLDIHVIKMDSFRALLFNNGKAKFADKRIRQAFMYAIDRQSVINAYVYGYGDIPDFPFTHVTYGYEPLPQYDFNQEMALELIQEVGWVVGEDGLLYAENVEGVDPGTQFTAVLETQERYLPIAVVIQSNLEDIGVSLEINIVDTATWNAENLGKEDKPYDLSISGGGWLGSDTAGYSWAYFAGDTASSNLSYFNEEVQDLFNLTMAAETKEEKAEYIYQMAEILWDELPMAPLLWQNWVFASSSRLHIEEAGINPGLFALFTYPEKIWVED